MSTIRDIVDATLAERGFRQYSHEPVVGQVVTALEQREQTIYTQLLDAGTELGAERDEVVGILDELGLQRPPMAVAQSNGHGVNTLDEGEREELTSIRHDLAGLMERIDHVLG